MAASEHEGSSEVRLSRRALLIGTVLGAIGATGVVVSVINERDDTFRPGLGIPAYAYPGTTREFWDGVAKLPAGTPIVVNPASGPGERVDPLYSSVVDALLAKGIAVLGYVDTSFGTRDHQLLVSEARQYHEWYGVKGVFLDQTPGDAAHVDAFATTVKTLRTFAPIVAMNPGQPEIDRRFADLADHVMNFEGPLDTYRSTQFPAWVRSYPRDRFWHLVYDVADTSAMSHTVTLVGQRHAGRVYITDAGMPNPWDRLPTYWTAELDALRIKPST